MPDDDTPQDHADLTDAEVTALEDLLKSATTPALRDGLLILLRDLGWGYNADDGFIGWGYYEDEPDI